MYLMDDIQQRRPPAARRDPRAGYDVAIVGGGPAGLSAALVLGRARRRVLVIDNGKPANAVSQGVGGLLGQTRVKPEELRAAGHEQLAAHPTVEVVHDEVAAAEQGAGAFELTLARRGSVVA